MSSLATLHTIQRPVRTAGCHQRSFYWHFAGRAELLGATLNRWEERTTSEAIRALDAVSDYRRRLELILEAAFQPPRARSLYAALAEATDDPIVGAALNRVATARVGADNPPPRLRRSAPEAGGSPRQPETTAECLQNVFAARPVRTLEAIADKATARSRVSGFDSHQRHDRSNVRSAERVIVFLRSYPVARTQPSRWRTR